MDEPALAGVRIVVTRPRGTGARLVSELERLGADATEVPLVEIEPADEAEIDETFPGDADWVVVTSANAVRAVGEYLGGAEHAWFAAVGPATADALRGLGIEPDFVPDRFAADAIAAGLGEVEGLRIVLAQADIASPALADELRARGALVDIVLAYRTVAREPGPEEVEALRQASAIVLASGSAARSLAAQGGAGDALVVCIGPQTAEVARDVGLSVDLVAHEATSEGIIRALVEHYGEST